MKSTVISLAFLFAALTVSCPAFAGGGEPAAATASSSSHEKGGTNLQGQSGDFQDYLNEGDDGVKESNSIELADLGEDAKLAVGGDDPAVGVKVGY